MLDYTKPVARKIVKIKAQGSQKSILPAYVARRAGTRNMVILPARQAGNRFLGSLQGLQIWARAF
jgi:hypothetical protein